MLHLDFVSIRARLQNLLAAKAEAVDQISKIHSLRQGRIFALGSGDDALYALFMRQLALVLPDAMALPTIT